MESGSLSHFGEFVECFSNFVIAIVKGSFYMRSLFLSANSPNFFVLLLSFF